MGVPSLFKNMIEFDDSIHIEESNHECDHFYIDYNNLIHYCVHEISSNTEEDLINEVIRYTSYLITKVVKPKKLVYLAFDGPVPIAKMIKQRGRRYKKIQDVNYKKKMSEKLGLEFNYSFDTNKISPGTSFMTKLSSRLRNFVSLGAFNRHVQKDAKFNVIISDSSVPGEGEHKIFQFVKNAQNPKVTIYGMDADLIILSFQSNIPTIKLVREEVIDESVVYKYFNVDKCLQSMFIIFEVNHDKYDKKRIIQDFVYFCSLGGNDFVPGLPGLEIKDGGLMTMFNKYKNILDENMTGNSPYLINNELLPNYEFLKTFLEQLAVDEFTNVNKKHNKIRKSCNSERYKVKQGLTKKEKLDCYLQNYSHCYYHSNYNPFNNFYKDELNSIDYNNENWFVNYNDYFFSEEDMENVCNSYLHSLKWCFDYYTNNVPPSWYYFYDYRVAPNIHTILEYDNLFTRKTAHQHDLYFRKMLPKNIKEDGPLTQYEQMLAILPMQNIKLLPEPFECFVKDEGPLSDMYARNFKLDVNAGHKNIYSEPLLPKIDFWKIKCVLNNVILNEQEWSRNVLRSTPFKRTFGVKQNENSK